MKVIARTNNGYIMELDNAEIGAFCGIQTDKGADRVDIGGITIGDQLTLSPLYTRSSKIANAAAQLGNDANTITAYLNSLEAAVKSAKLSYITAHENLKALADMDMPTTRGGNYNTRKVTIQEPVVQFEPARHD